MILGITGKIASGKSEVLKILKKKGFYAIDADKIVHDLYKAGASGAIKVAAYFGKKFLNNDGSVNRKKLRDEVFNNDDERKYLENLIHPEVYSEIEELLGKHKDRDVAIEAVYFDANFLNDFVNKLIWVERDEDKILNTLMNDRGFDLEMAKKLVSLIEKPGDVKLILENNSALDDFKNLVLKTLNL